MTLFYTVDEVAVALRVSPGTIRNKLSRGEGADLPPSVRLGRRRLFPQERFEAWLRAHLASDAMSSGESGEPITRAALGRPRLPTSVLERGQ
jgi:excisionase family DNA binding protein